MSIAVWAAGYFGVAGSVGVRIAPALTPPWLYQHIVWGGIWGFLFIFPIPGVKAFSRGTLVSLFRPLYSSFISFHIEPVMAWQGQILGFLRLYLCLSITGYGVW